MNIGILMNKMPQSAGGGFTFEESIYQELLRTPTNHRLYVFYRDNAPQETVNHIRYVQLQEMQETHCEEKMVSYDTRSIKNQKIKKYFKRFVDLLSGGYLSSLEINIQKQAKRLKKQQRQIDQLHQKLERSLDNSPDYDNPLNRTVIEHQIDVVWFLSIGFFRPIRIPYFVTVWDLEHRKQPYFPEVNTDGWKWEQRERYYETMLSKASKIITGTEIGKHEIQEFYRIPAKRIEILPQPTPCFVTNHAAKENANADILTTYHIPSRYLFYPAQFWAHKNHVGILSAVKRLKEQHQLIFPVVFVGSDQGNLSHVRRMVTAFDLTEQVYFLGFVPTEDLLQLYRRAFALIFMSFFGPDNLPPLEAFALECPVIASNIPGAREQLGDAAILVNPQDEQELADAIRMLVEQPEMRQTLLQRGLQRSAQWTTPDYVKRFLEVVDEFSTIRRCWSHSESL